jgi:hypothetical protein
MTNGATIQARVYRGYGIAARVIGSTYQFYRPGNPPIPTGNFDTPGRTLDTAGKQFDKTFEQFDTGDTFDGDKLLDQAVDPDLIDQTKLDAQGATLDDNVSFDQPGNLLFSLPVSLNAEDMKYGRPNKYGKATWYALVDGTNLAVGDYFIGQQGTFFIATMQALLPILVVECNRVVNIFRPYSQTGLTGRAPYGGNTDKKAMLLVAGRPCSILQGTKGEKGDAQLPGDVRSPWWTVLIPQADTDIRMDDIIKDDRGVRYAVSSSELTDAGFRLTCMQAAP